MKKVEPRVVPDRDARYMGLAWIIASFSKDPSTQVGAVIVDPVENKQLGTGYNGPPSNIDDNDISWARPDKYDYINHAEDNAIDHSFYSSLKGATIYVTAMPCKACMKRIVSKKISRVVYCEFNKNKKSMVGQDIEKIKEIAKKGKVELDLFDGNLAWLQDWILNMNNLNIFSNLK